MKRAGVLIASWCAIAASAASAQSDIDRLEKELAVLQGEAGRLEALQNKLPDVFSPIDRTDRTTWGSVYRLAKQYDRAALALFGAIEAGVGGDDSAESQAETLYLLGDSLYELGNPGAARVYFERLLRLPNHTYLDDGILRLMALAADDGRYDDADRYYAQYVAIVGSMVPGQVRYIRARSLFVAQQDAGALEELSRIPSGDRWDLRGRYLRTAILTRQDKLEEALAIVDAAVQQPAEGQQEVREILILARARLLYELDRLGESIDAYQEIGLDSPHLAKMLYEVTLTYVRRGQLALRAVPGDGFTDMDRRDKARIEYKKALRQLEDLRALDLTGEDADSDLLAASLLLQVQDFDGAHERFAEVVARFEAADSDIQRVAADADVRNRIIQDILALERDPRATLTSPLPGVAVRRAARQRDVARSISAFKSLQHTRDEITELERVLVTLEQIIAADNPARAEAIQSFQSAVERSQALVNASTSLRVRALAAERTLTRLSPEQMLRMEALTRERAELEKRLAAAPQTAEDLIARRARWREQLQMMQQSIHELELTVKRLRAGATATAWLAQQEPGLLPAQRASAQADADAIGKEVVLAEAALEEVKREAVAMTKSVATAGGAGSGDEVLRQHLLALIDQERALLRAARSASSSSTLDRLDRVDAGGVELLNRTRAFRARIDTVVDDRLSGARETLRVERQALDTYRRSLEGIEANAGDLRAQATAVALDRVRREVSRIVLRGDVGIIDTAFARKQAETETISALQRARSAELTDLTQAYADLTRDEMP